MGVTAADRPYGEFYDFYSVSPENFGSTLVFMCVVFIAEQTITFAQYNKLGLKCLHVVFIGSPFCVMWSGVIKQSCVYDLRRKGKEVCEDAISAQWYMAKLP